LQYKRACDDLAAVLVLRVRLLLLLNDHWRVSSSSSMRLGLCVPVPHLRVGRVLK